MLKKMSAGLILLALTLFSCRNLTDDDTYSAEVKKVQEEVTAETLTKKVVDAYYLNENGLQCDEGAYELFFTPDGDIPYVEVDSFLSKWFGGYYIITKEDAVYKIVNKNNQSFYISIDFSTGNVFYSDFDKSFIPPAAATSTDLIENNTVIKRTAIVDIRGANTSVSANLKDYNIPLIYENNLGFIPVNTLTLITGTGNEFLYNGQAVFCDTADNFRNTTRDAAGNTYGSIYSQKIHNPKDTYSKAFSEYSYGHLALAMDLFYGRKKYLGVSDFKTWLNTTGVKEGLCSTNLITAEQTLSDFLLKNIGDLHTYFHHLTPFYKELYNSQKLGKILFPRLDPTISPNPSDARYNNNSSYLETLWKKETKSSCTADGTPMNIFIPKKGDNDATANTIFLYFTSFDTQKSYDFYKDNWKYADFENKDVSQIMSFYKSENGTGDLTKESITTLSDFVNTVSDLSASGGASHGWGISLSSNTSDNTSDTILLTVVSNYIIQELNKGNTRPIKNVILDLSMNGGGACDDETFMSSWFLGQSNWHFVNNKTGSASSLAYIADINFDGNYNKINQYAAYSISKKTSDINDPYDTICNLNRFCITSLQSFSCGNIFPAQICFADTVKKLGQRSGGGTCAVKNIIMPSGTYFSTSSQFQFSTLINGSYVDIDNGAEVDVAISPMDFTNVYNRAEFCKQYLEAYK
ncbi:Peptidase family S41 [Treponema sp. JC4]|uniref:S41 family peptidase n=1 Tax=Treponema sp. JC4 TaxID=1124982 RepID=UPI00025B0A7B|nr:S41 family peptidase [Treponema sp. JC4]EID85269.1 Peptidase family S41 [Treponema sp. JC4]